MLTEDAMAAFAAHQGMATAHMLTVAGVSRSRRQRLVLEGVLEVLYERVFHIMSSPMNVESQCAALCLAYPSSFITGPTAGRLLGLRRMPAGPIHLSVPHGSHIGPHDGVRLRQTTRFDSSHVTKHGPGIRIAAPARLAFDLGQDLTMLDHRSVVEQMVHQRLTSWPALVKISKQLCHPARPGSARFVELLRSRLPGGAAESHPEIEVAAGLQSRGVPVHLQVGYLHLPNGKRIRFDMAVPDRRWAVEVDVHPGHSQPLGIAGDKQRDRWCHRIDWQVERVTEVDLIDMGVICDELADLYRARCVALDGRA
ncbi:MAG: hypothetical protein ACKPDI_05180 [Actinomycetota bacterium]